MMIYFFAVVENNSFRIEFVSEGKNTKLKIWVLWKIFVELADVLSLIDIAWVCKNENCVLKKSHCGMRRKKEA